MWTSHEHGNCTNPTGAVGDDFRGAAWSLAQFPIALHGIEFPCGGTGLCGGCRVRVHRGSLPVTPQDSLFFSAEDWPAVGGLPARPSQTCLWYWSASNGIWRSSATTQPCRAQESRASGIAIDLGTTTIAAQLIDLATGNVLGVETELNPQAAFGSDVMSRIRAACRRADLTTIVRASIGSMIERLARHRKQEVAEVVLVGNTVMHHLFSNLDVEPLSHAPFHSPNLGEQRFSAAQLGGLFRLLARIRFTRCLGGFVGSDILAGIVAVGMPTSKEMISLVDLGTNGEIAIGNRDRILYASTAAGPAFEAASIRMGMRASSGAISRVSHSRRGNSRYCHRRPGTARHLRQRAGRCSCGGIGNRRDSPSGRIANGTKIFPVAGPVILYQADIRELQLAKAAIAAGSDYCCDLLSTQPEELQRIHLAGAFGNYVQACSAIGIGLLEFSPQQILPSGNTALRGAKMLATLQNEPACITQDGTCGVGRRPGFSGRVCELHEFSSSPAACLMPQPPFCRFNISR